VLKRWRLILRYLPPYRGAIAGGALALLVGNTGVIAAPYAMFKGVVAIENGDPVDPWLVASWAGIAVAATAIGAAGNFGKRFLLMRTSRRAEAHLRRDLFRHIQHLPASYLDGMRTGDLMSRATSDLEAARMAIGPAVMYFADSILKFSFALAVMLTLNAELTAYALTPLLGICGGLVYLAPRIHRESRIVQDRLAAISARAQESFAGGRVVKTFATEDREVRTMDVHGDAYLDANMRLARVRGATMAWLHLMGAGGLIVILFVGGGQVIDGEFTFAGLLLFNSYLFILVWPMMAFGWVLSMIQRGAAGIDRIAEVFAVAPEVTPPATGKALRGKIELRDLSFAFNGTPILQGVSVHVPAGSTLGIIGPTGSGKSTLVSLLTRLYDPPRGTILVDGQEIHDVALADLRRAIALVPQEAFLFSTTIRENVAFAREDGEVERAVRDAHLHHDVEGFPEGLDTVVGERGVTLSGGQKQRTALARALAADAPILILDDALSAVDTETEMAILRNLRRIGDARTVIVVAHRISALRHADRILYLCDGRVAEAGTHTELVALGGAYARLARAQELEAEIQGMDG